MSSHDRLAIINESASEYVAERLSKADVGGESETDLGVVGAEAQQLQAAGPGDAAKPGELGALSQLSCIFSLQVRCKSLWLYRGACVVAPN